MSILDLLLKNLKTLPTPPTNMVRVDTYNRCLDSKGLQTGTTPGSIGTWDCGDHTNLAWNYVPDTKELKLRDANWCLSSVGTEKTANGDPRALIAPCNRSDAQKWEYNSAHQLKTPSGQCLAYDEKEGVPIIYTCDASGVNNPHQWWNIAQAGGGATAVTCPTCVTGTTPCPVTQELMDKKIADAVAAEKKVADAAKNLALAQATLKSDGEIKAAKAALDKAKLELNKCIVNLTEASNSKQNIIYSSGFGIVLLFIATVVLGVMLNRAKASMQTGVPMMQFPQQPPPMMQFPQQPPPMMASSLQQPPPPAPIRIM